MLETSWRRRESFPLDRPRRTSDSIFKERNTCTFDPAARGARAVHELCPSKDRGRRESRVSDAPAASCAKVESTRVVTTGSPDPSGFPCTMVLTAYFVLSPVTGSFATVASQISGASNPVERMHIPQDLTPASGRQNHTTSPSATCIVRLRAGLSLTGNPPCDHLRTPTLSRPPHPAPRP